MFLWVFVAALICSQVSHLYRTTFIGLDDFTISDAQLKSWISQADSSARAGAGSAGSSGSGDEVDSEFDYWISADTASAEQVVSHLNGMRQREGHRRRLGTPRFGEWQRPLRLRVVEGSLTLQDLLLDDNDG